jgi:hypothetical protein
MTNQEVVHVFKKGQDEEVQVSIGEFKNRKYVDFRIYFPGEDGTKFPTKRGLTLAAELLPELKKGLQAAEQKTTV